MKQANVSEQLSEDDARLEGGPRIVVERKFIERLRLTQEEAAGFFGVPRPKISNILGNKLDGISIEYLVRMLARTGGKLRYSFRQPPKRVAQARVRRRRSA